MKKKIKTLAVAITFGLMSVSAFAASSTTFTVNNVSVTGRVTYVDESEWNPLTKDSVTATTTAKSAMDNIKAKATIYYTDGSQTRSTAATASVDNGKSASKTVSASGSLK